MVEPIIFYNGLVVSRLEPKKAGLKRYFTGRPCPHGHVSERWVSGTGCVECHKKRRQDNPADKALGIVKDSVTLLRAMADYVERHNVEADSGHKECSA